MGISRVSLVRGSVLCVLKDAVVMGGRGGWICVDLGTKRGEGGAAAGVEEVSASAP